MQANNPRVVGPGLALLGTLCLAVGCEAVGRPRRGQGPAAETAAPAEPAKGDELDSTKILDVQSDPEKPRTFFRGTRLPGGLSDEAREIESHMNIR